MVCLVGEEEEEEEEGGAEPLKGDSGSRDGCAVADVCSSLLEVSTPGMVLSAVAQVGGAEADLHGLLCGVASSLRNATRTEMLSACKCFLSHRDSASFISSVTTSVALSACVCSYS